MKHNRRQKLSVFFLTVGLVLGLFMVSVIQMKSTEERRIPIELSEPTDKKILDCPDCQSVFPLLFYRNLFSRDMIFVNMNHSSNRQYIQKYQLRSVPTIVNKKQKMTGTNQQNILKFLKEKP